MSLTEYIKDRMKQARTHKEENGRYTISLMGQQRPVKGSFSSEESALDAMSFYFESRYEHYVDACHEAEVDRETCKNLIGLSFSTSEPGWWLNKLPEGVECTGRTVGQGWVTLYFVADQRNPEAMAGVAMMRKEWRDEILMDNGHFRDTKVNESREAEMRWISN